MHTHHPPDRRARRSAFTLVELIVVVAIVALLAALVAGAAGGARRAAGRARCLATMRQVGGFIGATSLDRAGRLPRSLHSAVAVGEPPWAHEYYRHVMGEAPPPPADRRWSEFVGTHLRCPFDGRDADAARRRYSSYGLNVYFELTAEETGGPTYRTLSRIALPARTILVGELREDSNADHVMAHFWPQYSAPSEVAIDRHGHSEGYLFVDGHVEDIPYLTTFNPDALVDLWNPATAR